MPDARSDIRVDQYATEDHLVFVVFSNRGVWKRLQPTHGGQAPVWMKRNGNGPVSGKLRCWLEGIWERADEFPRVARFPRLASSSRGVEQE